MSIQAHQPASMARNDELTLSTAAIPRNRQRVDMPTSMAQPEVQATESQSQSQFQAAGTTGGQVNEAVGMEFLANLHQRFPNGAVPPAWRVWDRDSEDFVFCLRQIGHSYDAIAENGTIKYLGFTTEDCEAKYNEIWAEIDGSRDPKDDEGAPPALENNATQDRPKRVSRTRKKTAKALEAEQASAGNRTSTAWEADPAEPWAIELMQDQSLAIDTTFEQQAQYPYSPATFDTQQPLHMLPTPFFDNQQTQYIPPLAPLYVQQPQYRRLPLALDTKVGLDYSFGELPTPTDSTITVNSSSNSSSTTLVSASASDDSAKAATRKRKRGPDWTTDEDTFLRTTVAAIQATNSTQPPKKRPRGVDWKQVAAVFSSRTVKRTAGVCRDRWSRLNFSEKRSGGDRQVRRNSWSAEDDRRLQEMMAERKTYVEIAKVMQRTYDAVKKRWSNLNTGRVTRPGEKTEATA